MPLEATRRRRGTASPRGRSAFGDDVLAGLRRERKSLPCKHFYDRRGSELFDQICELPEYYPTRTELGIMQTHAEAIAAAIGPRVALVEYGSGSSLKTRRLLDALDAPAAYLPVDISAEHLRAVADDLTQAYPSIEVAPIAADFTQPFELPELSTQASHTAVYFPGSTIGNFVPAEARRLLGQIASLVGEGGGLVIGVDLQKETSVLEAAYNDARGVTAAFNKNLLHRINRELDADIDATAFQHRAVYDDAHGRISLSLVSDEDQTAVVEGERIEFAEGEAIHTEYSHKYTVAGFADLAAEAGFALHAAWTDEREWFAVLHLVVEKSGAKAVDEA